MRYLKAKALIDEGLLLVRDWGIEGENVGFTFDMIGGFVIANYLIEVHKSNLKVFITSKNSLTGLSRRTIKQDIRLPKIFWSVLLLLSP
ncbi:MAG: hypothetical protein IPP79_14475 [Chitinophagaceae bacterium]|nr:hypothetical protein [Chitinophagaceae bacterium]